MIASTTTTRLDRSSLVVNQGRCCVELSDEVVLEQYSKTRDRRWLRAPWSSALLELDHDRRHCIHVIHMRWSRDDEQFLALSSIRQLQQAAHFWLYFFNYLQERPLSRHTYRYPRNLRIWFSTRLVRLVSSVLPWRVCLMSRSDSLETVTSLKLQSRLEQYKVSVRGYTGLAREQFLISLSFFRCVSLTVYLIFKPARITALTEPTCTSLDLLKFPQHDTQTPIAQQAVGSILRQRTNGHRPNIYVRLPFLTGELMCPIHRDDQSLDKLYKGSVSSTEHDRKHGERSWLCCDTKLFIGCGKARSANLRAFSPSVADAFECASETQNAVQA